MFGVGAAAVFMRRRRKVPAAAA
ncbi:hypothetical protein [Altererythrobacter sp. Root672]